ncbi:NADP-dependent oxidoreductase [Actinoallomurus purpureus]|uniref:NADP-dependent oxidoreductase n=1 Tax=Actinoallomurus purpureus TaxID=478114 RepID=UPI00209386F0|nr:NADP-dependent oxidoreductase [Actinoallomurus purpureus]MCO6010706.1 NADP-dependent oxidoreductase [Actinoallomurus purpureus]
MKTREVHLVSRPHGWPEPTDFALVETELPPPGDGEALVRNLFMSVDPYMRGRMNDVKSYTPPFALNEVMTGGAIGEVVESNSPDLRPGDVVLHQLGWREHAVAPADQFHKVTPVDGVSPSAFLGVLGMPGLTAYAGLLDIAGMKEGDTVFVSGAAGAVGSLVGQIARLRGAARVIGSAGSDEKVAYLTDRLGFDAAFNYKSGLVRKLLAEAAPDGIDVYFDNVGGDHLEAAIEAFNNHGRAAICGAISMYNATEPQPAPRNLPLMIGKRLTLRGFIVIDHYHQFGDFVREVGGWLAEGQMEFEETVFEGVDHAVDAFLAMLRGQNTGKMIVRL